MLHAAVALLLIRVVTHQQGAPLPKKAVTVIALQSLLPAVPAPSAEAPHLAPAKPRSRPRQAVAKAAAPAATWQTPPAPTPQPPPAPSAETVAAVPAPSVPVPDPAPTPITASSPAAPPAAASAQLDAPLPIAYLTEVSRMIRVHLNYPAQTRKHGIAVVHIRIGRDGTVLGAGVVQSSGNQALDEEAEAVVLRIHQFPEPPSAYVSAIGDFVIDQPIRFMG